MPRTKKSYFVTGTLALLAAIFIVTRFSETNRFIRFTEEIGVDRGKPFESGFVSTEGLMGFMLTRGYEDPFVYFEEGLGLSPDVDRLSDPGLSPNQRENIASEGADTLTVYSIERRFGFFSIERRILIYHSGREIKNMSSRTFETSL